MPESSVQQVIIIDDEEEENKVQSQYSVQKQVIVIGDSDDNPSPVPQQTSTRFSDLFEEFRAKWKSTTVVGEKREQVSIADLAESVSVESIEPVVKKSRKHGNREKTRKIKSKTEALKTIEIVIDDRLIVNKLIFPNTITVTLERLPFEYKCVIWRDIASYEEKDWIVVIVEMTESLLSEYNTVIETIIQETGQYSNRILLLEGFKQFSTDYEKMVQKRFTKAVKDNRRFSGNGSIDLHTWHHKFMLSCLRHQVNLFTVGNHGAMSASIEAFLVEWSKAIAWDSVSGPSKTKPVKCGKDLQDTWRKMLECLPRMPVAVVDAIVRRFPTARALIDGLTSNGPSVVERLAVNEQRTVGAAVSQKLHHLFTNTDLSNRLL